MPPRAARTTSSCGRPAPAERRPSSRSLTAFAAPNSPPVSKTFTQTGTWTFICTLHSTYNAVADTWTGMVGTAAVAPAQASGVDYTESRVDGGAWGKGPSVTVSAPGAHTVEFRSADKAGNVETAKSVGFSIEQAVTPLPTVQPTATPAPPAATPTPGPSLAAVVQAGHAAKTTVAKFAKSGLAVRATCTQVMSGQATLTVTSKVRKALKLKSATLAKGTVGVQGGRRHGDAQAVRVHQACAGQGQAGGQGQVDHDPQAGGRQGAHGLGERDAGPQVAPS